MAKKTARPTAKPSQQRSKEEQWRRRMAQQSQMGAGVGGAGGAGSAVAEPGTQRSTAASSEDGATQAEVPTATRASSMQAARRAASASAVAQRANMAGARGGRVRLGAATLPLTEEMRYIRGDIRKLVILTAICLVVLIALSFIVPMVIK